MSEHMLSTDFTCMRHVANLVAMWEDMIEILMADGMCLRSCAVPSTMEIFLITTCIFGNFVNEFECDSKLSTTVLYPMYCQLRGVVFNNSNS